jgi:serine/threonine protein kinase
VDGPIGREIAGFRIEREIGRGGMGVVYLATQVFPERRVALKLLSSDLASDPSFRERFVRESNAAASTEHPNIVPVYGAGESDGQLYLAMRFIEGNDLRTLLEHEGTLSPDRAARICAEVADALEAAHERGLVHRDVKPSNVLLDGRDRAYLSDFGLIRATRIDTEITKTGQFMGTVDYVAPEQIRGDELDGRADVYSLGCVLYECLTGSPPFRRDSEVATMYAHLEQDVPAPSTERDDLPRSLDEVVTKATAKRPADRFATAGEMRRAGHGADRPDRRQPLASCPGVPAGDQ